MVFVVRNCFHLNDENASFQIIWVSMETCRFFITLIAIASAGYCLAQDEADYRCELMLGDWSGVHEQEGDRSYRFDAALDEDGSIMVDFDYFDAGTTDRHEGYWLCDNGVFTTGMLTRGGGSILYHYQILDIDQASMTYRQISPGPDYPIFHSMRVGARPMTPELFDRLND